MARRLLWVTAIPTVLWSISINAAELPEEQELALAYGDKNTISIATGSKQLLRRAPSVATVITAEDIEAMGATDLDEVLETVPGIHVSRSNQGYAPLYFIHGIASEFNPQTLMLQNGVPMTTLFVGNRGLSWGGLSVHNIARIEIIRGPGSALYGADAYSGVINIITKTANDISGTEFGARAGSFHSRDGWIQHGGRLGPVEVAGYLRVGHTDGFRSIVDADAQTGLDQLFGTHISLAPGPVNTGNDAIDASVDLAYDKWRLRAGYKSRDHLGTGGGVASALDPVSDLNSERVHADLSLDDGPVAQDLKLGLLTSFLHYKQLFSTPLQLFPAGAFGGLFPTGMFGAPYTWERQWRFSAWSIYSGFANHNVRFGLGHDDLNLYRTRELKNFTFISSGPLTGLPAPTPGGEVIEFPVEQSFLTPHRRKVNYVYAQDEWHFVKDWTLTAGVRYDRFSDFGGTTNPRLALVWDATLDVTAKLLYGSAFRAPAFTEEFSINNPVARGNPNLRPEKIKTLEAVVSWQANKDTLLNLSAFRYDMKDIIHTVPDVIAGAASTFQNTGSQHGYGADFDATWDVNRHLRLVGNYSYQHSIDELTGQDAGYAPHHHIYARADWLWNSGWLMSGQVNHVADRKRAAGDARPPVPDYTTVDATLRSGRAWPHWEVALSVRNLFDADAREPSLAPGSIPNDLPLAGRSIYLQVIYRL